MQLLFVAVLASACLATSSSASSSSGAAVADATPAHAIIDKGPPTLKVHCSEQEMTVEVAKPPDAKEVYLEHLKHYPDKACRPQPGPGGRLRFNLSLVDIFRCMVTKVVDREAGLRVYYHRVIVEKMTGRKEAFLVRCDSEIFGRGNSSEVVSLVKRSAQFPANFQEPDYDVEITSEIVGRAPIPELVIGVKQLGVLIDDELTVKPGTPLSMEIYLDNESADIYGVMVSKLEVTDSGSQNEILVFNGCTVDPYLFENFLTEDGDLLRAKFRAFKFPESNYVLFKGVVSVCLDVCNAVECANGQLGYGRRRRRRSISKDQSDLQRVYEVSVSTIVKIDEGIELTTRPETRQDTAKREVAQKEERQILPEKGRFIGDEKSLLELAEQFGSMRTFVDFEFDEESSSAQKTTATEAAFAFLLASVLLSFLNLGP